MVSQLWVPAWTLLGLVGWGEGKSANTPGTSPGNQHARDANAKTDNYNKNINSHLLRQQTTLPPATSTQTLAQTPTLPHPTPTLPPATLTQTPAQPPTLSPPTPTLPPATLTQAPAQPPALPHPTPTNTRPTHPGTHHPAQTLTHETTDLQEHRPAAPISQDHPPPKTPHQDQAGKEDGIKSPSHVGYAT